MNYKEFWNAVRMGSSVREYDYKSRNIQKSLKYNHDPNATVRHHLMDTEEQRKYNDEHYELWGFEIDENGNESFTYGKYVIFVTPEEHRKIHTASELTRQRISRANSGKKWSEESKKNLSIKRLGVNNPMYGIRLTGEKNGMYGKHHTDETKNLLSKKFSGENNPMYGRKGELAPCYGRCGELHPMFGKQQTDEAKKKISEIAKKYHAAVKYMYSVYKENNGNLKWNGFRLAIKTGDITFIYSKPSVFIAPYMLLKN